LIRADEELQEVLARLLGDRKNLSLLEAGCGSVSHIGIPNVARVAGIDVSPAQLARNRELQEKIVGDLQTYPLPGEAFDVIVSWNVLEHIADPLSAMANLFRSLKKEGFLVLALPNLLSWKGLAAKATPYPVHALFYRFIIGDRRKRDFDQFPTYLRLSTEPRRLCRFAERHGFSTVHLRLYEGPVQTHLRGRSRLLNRCFSLLGMLSRLATLGRIDLNLSDCFIILKKG
jgi:SAM-dependent methyltransferase